MESRGEGKRGEWMEGRWGKGVDGGEGMVA